MSAVPDTTFEPVTANSAPDNFELLSVIALEPINVLQTPPATAKLFMSPEFTNPGGADAEHGKTRDYVVAIEYPDPLDDTVVRMNDCATVHGSRIFRGFVGSVAEEKGYTTTTQDITEYL